MKAKIYFCLGWLFLPVLLAVTHCLAAPSPMVGWQRGDGGTTWQEWYFDQQTDPVNIPAEQGYNPYGTAQVDIGLDGISEGVPPGWLESRYGRTGIWHSLFTEVFLTIPNSSKRNQYKEVWVTVGFTGVLMPSIYYPAYPGEIYGPRCTAYIGGTALPAAQVTEIGRTVVVDVADGWPWQILTIGWRIEPNPDSEEIYLAFHNSGADIDYVIADTLCAGPPPGGEGCTPGYWKQPQHFDSWPDGYDWNTRFVDVFKETAFGNRTLLQVLMLKGGGLNALGRHTVAALLNSASGGVSYDLTPEDVIALFQAAYPGSPRAYEKLKNVFAGYNEQGCPLD